MVIRCLILTGTLIATATVNAAAGDFAIRGNVAAFHGVPWARGTYAPWFGCTPPYHCGDPVQWRLLLERERRMQELRERATQSAPRVYEPGDGPWGPQRYIPPATPEANIQPAHRGTSQLRPEYQRSGQPIAEPGTESLK